MILFKLKAASLMNHKYLLSKVPLQIGILVKYQSIIEMLWYFILWCFDILSFVQLIKINIPIKWNWLQVEVGNEIHFAVSNIDLIFSSPCRLKQIWEVSIDILIFWIVPAKFNWQYKVTININIRRCIC